MKRFRSLFQVLMAVLLALGVIGAFPIAPASAVSPDVRISQVYGGGGNSGATLKNDFIELFNAGTTTVSVAGWSVQYSSAAGSFGTIKTDLTGSIAPGKYYLIMQAAGSGGTVDLPTPDATGTIAMSGTAGKVALVNSTTFLTGTCPTGNTSVVDFVGFGTAASCFEGTGPTPTLSNTTAALRASGGCTDTDNNAADFTAGAPAPRNTASPTKSCLADTAPSVASTLPANNGSAGRADNISVTFSEPVTVVSGWYSISCTSSGLHSATVDETGDPTFVLNPAVNFNIGDVCTVTIDGSKVNDDDTDDTIADYMVGTYAFSFNVVTGCGDPYTPIYDIQGTGETSPKAGLTVSTEGVVIGDFQTGGKNGYYIQEPIGDGDPLTSDGIFVYNTSTAVNIGDRVRVRGTAVEYLGITEVSPVTQVLVCSTGNSVAPTNVSLPVTAVTDFEKYESMLVTFPQALIISEYFNFDRYGEIVLTSQRHMTPTAIVEPGAPAQAEAAAYLLDRITLDDGRTNQNPDPAYHPNGAVFNMSNLFRGGGTVQNVTGVMDYFQNLYRVQPTTGAIYTPANPRTAAPEITEGDLKVSSFNVLNYFVTLDAGTSAWICGPAGNMECRGADANQPDEFTRQRNKILAALAAIDADVFGLMEIENDRPGGLDAVADLVAGLNSVPGVGPYAFIDTGFIGGDAIKQAILYKPAAVTPIGGYQILDSSIDPRFIDTANRPVLAQVFSDNLTGVEFVVAVNHLKSKGSACVGDPDLGDGAGNCNLTRKAAAEALVDWLADPEVFPGVKKALIIGDLNSYDKEDPIDMINLGADDTADTADDFKDLIFEKQDDFAYGYVFDGQIGYLDHALASLGLEENVVDANFWHINADEPDLIDYDTSFKAPAQDALYEPNAYRSSDHDPVIVTLSMLGDFFATQDFAPWPGWPGAINLGWKWNNDFDIDTIASIEVGMLDAAGNVIVKYAADAEQVAWQKANGYINLGGQESAPFYQWYDGTPIVAGRSDDWTVVFGPSFAAWNPSLGFVKVVNLNGTVDYKTVLYTAAGTGLSDFFATQDFAQWPGWPGAFNLGWKWNDAFDIDTIGSIEVGMLDAAGNVIVKYTADAEQVAWQKANGYINLGGQESAPFYQWYAGTPIMEGRGDDWTVVFGPSFEAWNPGRAFIRVVALDGTVDYKTLVYTGTGVIYGDFFETQDFGPWGTAWVGAYNLGWKYNDSFDIQTIASIEVGMLDAAGNIIIKYTADAEQVAWQKLNSYITQGGQSSAPFYQEVDGMPIAEGRDDDWTVVFGPSFAAWSPAKAFVRVVALDGTVDYKLVAYTGTGDVYSDIFETQDFGLWGPDWPGAFNLGWKYNDSFDVNTIKLVEVGMLDASGNVIVRYTADLEQVAWQKANGYITPGGQESAPFYQEYNGNPIVEGRDDDWTVIFGPSFTSWNPTWAFVKVETLTGQMEYRLVPYLGVPALVDDMFEITDFGLWGDTWPGALSLGWEYTTEFNTDTIAAIEVGMLDVNGDLIVRYTANETQVAWQKANGYITTEKLSSAPFYHDVLPGVDLDWTVILGPAFDQWNPSLAYVRVVNTSGQIDYDEIGYIGAPVDQPPFLNVTGATSDGEPMAGDFETGYILQVTNNPAVDHEIQFAAGTTATEPLADEYFGLKLISSTVTPEALKAYYDARGVPEPYLTYLKAAADGDNPFVYIKGSDVSLVDAAKHDIGLVDVGMTIPDDFPVGTYVVRGAIYDEGGNGTLVTLTLIINDTPVASDQTVTVVEDTPTAITLTGVDTLPGTLLFTVVTQPTHGTLSGTAPALTYTPFLDYVGPDSFTFIVNDGMVDSLAGTISITVTPINDAPTAVDDEYTVVENGLLEVAVPGVMANDLEVDTDEMTVALVSNVSNGSLVLFGDGSFTYRPAPDFFGTDTFVYQLITYPAGINSMWTDEATVTITVTEEISVFFNIYLPLIFR